MHLTFNKYICCQAGRQPRIGRRNVACALLLALLVLSGSLFSCFAASVEETMQPSVLINPFPYGDTRNSASVPYSADLKGEILWKAETTLQSNPQPARQLAIRDDFLVVGYGPYIGMHQRASGASLWSWQIAPNAKFHLTSQGLVTLDHAGYYRILHFDKSLGDPVSLPFLGHRTFLFFIASEQHEFRYCYALLPSPTNSPADIVVPPQFTYMRYDVQQEDFIWEFIQESEAIDVLEDKPGHRMIVISRKALFSFPPDAKSEQAVLSRSFEDVLGASLDSTGKTLVVAREQSSDTFRLIALEADLKTTWQYNLGRAVTLLQPPCPMQDGSVSLLQGKDIINIKAGRQTWSVSIPGYSGQAYLTQLKDGSMLVAAGPALTQISAKGQKLRTISMQEPLTCRPIVDGAGRIYVAGTLGIYCLK